MKKQVHYLLPDSSRRTIDLATDKVLANISLLDEMMEISLSDNKPVAQRASRVVFRTLEKDNSLIDKWSEKIINSLEHINNDSVLANLLSVYSECKLPKDEELVGQLADNCFNYLNQITEREGLKICAMEILYKVSNFYPEIKNELILIIEKLMQECKMAFKSRGKKILNKLYKEVGLNIKYIE